MMFDVSKIFDLCKTFAVSDFLLKSQNCCIAMSYVNNSQTDKIVLVDKVGDSSIVLFPFDDFISNFGEKTSLTMN